MAEDLAEALSKPRPSLAYERQEAVFHRIETNGFVLAGGSDLSDGPLWEGGFVVLRKRPGWLPGSEITIPDQTCPACILAHHSACFPKWSASCRFPDGSSVDLPSSFRCTCPHPSHAQESE